MSIDIQRLRRRREISALLKSKLIEGLDLPYMPDDIAEDVSLIGSGLGLDSLDILEIAICVESTFSIKMPDSSSGVLRSFNTLIDFIIAESEAKNA